MCSESYDLGAKGIMFTNFIYNEQYTPMDLLEFEEKSEFIENPSIAITSISPAPIEFAEIFILLSNTTSISIFIFFT